ncbi:MAG: hypothetical protein AABX85_00120 [Nanoarchaeota archaeon]
MSQTNNGHYLDDRTIILSEEVNPELLREYNISYPSNLDLSKYKLIKNVYAGVTSFPILVEKS